MIGAWCKFGDGPLPEDGSAIVWLEFSTDPLEVIEGRSGSLRPAIYRAGTLFDQNGSSCPVPYGCWWTSLPWADERASVVGANSLVGGPGGGSMHTPLDVYSPIMRRLIQGPTTVLADGAGTAGTGDKSPTAQK